ncbi:cytochrome c5 family protein [Chromobacterium sp. ATCC 53434]|uniref:c-type cytochrome n=1 Tax=Chromobacterium sp. (strain ATCC 53434 / SC 14030) TaxID=2059672 RepID=UPI000C78253E|nr:c-type cytochrome [Chromobacterium sp. ATCC 53434]AUH52377.1 cytochrome c5 family protein [Chromobacterium sp. ATCC 53434]
MDADRKTAGRRPAALGAGAALLALLAACGGEDKPQPADLQKAETLRPADAALASKYERSCLSCHGMPASQAPLTGFAPAWEPRLRKGMPLLLSHVRDGLNAMPPRGYCNDCSDEEFTRLIAFMSGGGQGGTR